MQRKNRKNELDQNKNKKIIIIKKDFGIDIGMGIGLGRGWDSSGLPIKYIKRKRWELVGVGGDIKFQ